MSRFNVIQFKSAVTGLIGMLVGTMFICIAGFLLALVLPTMDKFILASDSSMTMALIGMAMVIAVVWKYALRRARKSGVARGNLTNV